MQQETPVGATLLIEQMSPPLDQSGPITMSVDVLSISGWDLTVVSKLPEPVPVKGSKKDVAKQAAEAAPPTGYMIAMTSLDNQETSRSKVFQFDRSDIAIGHHFEWSIAARDLTKVRDRFLSERLAIGIADESGTAIGTANIDTSGLAEGDFEVEGDFPITLASAVSLAAPAQMSIRISLSDAVTTEEQLELAVRGTLQVTSIVDSPALWLTMDDKPSRIGFSIQWPWSMRPIEATGEPTESGQVAVQHDPRQIILTRQLLSEHPDAIEIGVFLESPDDNAVRRPCGNGRLSLSALTAPDNASTSSFALVVPVDVLASALPPDVSADPDPAVESSLADGAPNGPTTITVFVSLARSLPDVSKTSSTKSITIEDLVPGFVHPKPPQHAKQTHEQQFRVQIEKTIATIAANYEAVRERIGGDADANKVRSELWFQLNNEGGYYDIKEQLKVFVAPIARQILKGQSTSTSAALTDLHQFLIGQANVSLAKVFTRDWRPPRPIVEPALNADDFMRQANRARLLRDDRELVRCLGRRAACIAIDTEEGIAARLDHVRALIRFGSLDESSDVLKDIVSHHQTSVPVRNALGAVLLELNPNSDEGIALQRLNCRTSSTPLCFVLRSIGLTRCGQQRLGQQVFHKGVRTSPPIAADQILGEAADFLLDLGAALQGQHALDWHHRLAPTIDGAWAYRQARCLSLANQWDRCAESCQRAIVGNATFGSAYRLLGEAMWRLNMTDQAVLAWEHMLMLRGPIDPFVCGALGRTYLDRGQWEMARQVLVMAVDADPLAITLRWLGEALLQQGSNEQALDALARANLLDRDDGEVWGLLALACVKQDRLNEAEQCIAICRRLNLHRTDIWTRLVDQYRSLGMDDFVDALTKQIPFVGEQTDVPNELTQ